MSPSPLSTSRREAGAGDFSASVFDITFRSSFGAGRRKKVSGLDIIYNCYEFVCPLKYACSVKTVGPRSSIFGMEIDIGAPFLVWGLEVGLNGSVLIFYIFIPPPPPVPTPCQGIPSGFSVL